MILQLASAGKLETACILLLCCQHHTLLTALSNPIHRPCQASATQPAEQPTGNTLCQLSCSALQATVLRAATQVVVVVDAKSINTVLGANQSLSKALEPISDKLLAQRSGHPTLFSAGTKTHWWKTVRKGTAPAFVQANVR